MRVRTATSVPARPADAAIAVGVIADGEGPGDPFLSARGFRAKAGEVLAVPGEGRRVRLHVGLGPAGEVTPAVLRRAAGAAARAAGTARTLVLDLTGGPASLPIAGGNGASDPHNRRQFDDGAAPAAAAGAAEAARAVAEGAVLGAYRYTAWRSSPPEGGLREVVVVTRERAAVAAGARAAEATCLARDLVNEPGGSLTAPVLAERIRAIAAEAGLRCRVHDERSLRRLGFGGLLAVNQGSTQPPRFVELGYTPAPARRAAAAPTVALVGKGITFDAGGLSIKSSEGMASMKSDMGGAAAIVGALSAARDLRVPVNVRAYLPMTDNMLGGDALRVGDVVRHYGGSTTEVLNTDAEGRLVLADALAYATEARRGHRRPDAVVDLATLTGACVVALGTRTAGLMGNDDGLCDRIVAAAGRAGEPVWRLPMPEIERRRIESKVADRKNVGNRYGGAIHAALFLRDFVAGGVPWAHLDIAGPAFNDDGDDGELASGGTGFGVRTLLELLTSF